MATNKLLIGTLIKLTNSLLDSLQIIFNLMQLFNITKEILAVIDYVLETNWSLRCRNFSDVKLKVEYKWW